MDLMGLEPATLDWRQPGSGEVPHSFPWRDAIRHAEASSGTRLMLLTKDGPRSFIVKAAPVLEKEGKAKGAIATFDDVTEFEKQSRDLAEARVRLEKSEQELRLQNEELEVLARTDPLTGVANRRSFMQTFEPHLAVARRDGTAVCCVMADLDLFKQINDSAGHAAGDDVIRRVADLLASEARSHEVVCRYGGEEFCVFLRDMGVEEATEWANRVRGKIASPGFARVPITSSFGVASISGGARTLVELINQADEALYAAKQAGRNRVSRWDERGGRV
jgi:diguanylate cyclase (GGDEF)-like protein